MKLAADDNNANLILIWPYQNLFVVQVPVLVVLKNVLSIYYRQILRPEFMNQVGSRF